MSPPLDGMPKHACRREAQPASVVRRSRAKVLVAEPVAVPLERKDLGVMDEAVDHRRRGHLVAEDLQALNGLFEVTIIEARS